MKNTRRSGNDTNTNKDVPAEGNQQLIAETLRNLNQSIITQTQLMQQWIQQMSNNNIFSNTAPTTQEQRYYTKCTKRKMVDQGQHDARNLKARVIQPQPNQAPTTTVFKTPGSAPHPPMQTFRNINDGQLQQNKTSRAGIQCFVCQDMGHYANQCPKGRLALTPDNIPEAILIATITPAAGRKANARILSQVQEYKSLGLPISQDEAVKHQASPSTSKLSAQGQPQKKFPPIASVTCFHCQEKGHYAHKCPKKQQAATPKLQREIIQANKKPQNSGRGRLYNVTTQVLSDDE